MHFSEAPPAPFQDAQDLILGVGDLVQLAPKYDHLQTSQYRQLFANLASRDTNSKAYRTKLLIQNVILDYKRTASSLGSKMEAILAYFKYIGEENVSKDGITKLLDAVKILFCQPQGINHGTIHSNIPICTHSTNSLINIQAAQPELQVISSWILELSKALQDKKVIIAVIKNNLKKNSSMISAQQEDLMQRQLEELIGKCSNFVKKKIYEVYRTKIEPAIKRLRESQHTLLQHTVIWKQPLTEILEYMIGQFHQIQFILTQKLKFKVQCLFYAFPCLFTLTVPCTQSLLNNPTRLIQIVRDLDLTSSVLYLKLLRDTSQQAKYIVLINKQTPFILRFQSDPISIKMEQGGYFQNLLTKIGSGLFENCKKIVMRPTVKIRTIKQRISYHIEYILGKTKLNLSPNICYQAVVLSVKDILVQNLKKTHEKAHDKKFVYYLSSNFLLGKCLKNALINLRLEDKYKQALNSIGYNLESIYNNEIYSITGNNGQERLAACFLDSFSTLNYPARGYGIRYNYGNCKKDLWQIERDTEYKVRFKGKVRKAKDAMGKEISYWQDTETIIAKAYDTLIPGYATLNTIQLRLWKSFLALDDQQADEGMQKRDQAEKITSILNPNDSTDAGKQLRLKQQYLFASATIQDILHCLTKETRRKFEWWNLPKEVSIHLNDTHSALSIIQMMRIMIDEEHLEQENVERIIYETFSYTNHSALLKSLEEWDVDVFKRLLPRHFELICRLKIKIKTKQKSDENRQSIISISNPQKIISLKVIMAYSHKANGVTSLHTQHLSKILFKNAIKEPLNITNGISPRRWLLIANPQLAMLYTSYLGSDKWVLNMVKLKELEYFAEQEQFQSQWQAIKINNKRKLAQWIYHTNKIKVNENSMFDIHIKGVEDQGGRLLKLLYVIYLYLAIKDLPPVQWKEVVPRTIIFVAAKQPYDSEITKVITELIIEVANVINLHNNNTQYLLRVVIIPRYTVANAQIIIPAVDFSQHISRVSTQEPEINNMMITLNGGVILGNNKGTNLELMLQIQGINCFRFQEPIEDLHQKRNKKQGRLSNQLINVKEAIMKGALNEKGIFSKLFDQIFNERLELQNGFKKFIDVQEQVAKTYQNRKKWNYMSILNAVRTRQFSSDKALKEYADKIWNLRQMEGL